MKIINPIYDKAFKYLMQNERIAKRVLEVILDQEVLELAVSQQETVVADDKRGFTLFRLDFKAVILDAQGQRQTVLIELQKSRFNTDLIRFRQYLGSNYIQTEAQTDACGTDKRVAYPIITIYILGYNIEEIPHLAVNVNRCIVDAVSHEPLDIHSDFIDKLTHRAHILQVRRLPEVRRSKLEQFMELFNQAKIAELPYFLNLDHVADEFSDIARYMHGPVADDDFRRQLEAEAELDNLFDEQEAKYLQQLRESRQREEEERRQKEEERRQKEEERRQKEEERRQKAEMARKLARLMKKEGVALEEIVEETGLTAQEIVKL